MPRPCPRAAGPIPADFDPPVDTEMLPVWLHRVYANPATAALVAMESTARLFPEAMADTCACVISSAGPRTATPRSAAAMT